MKEDELATELGIRLKCMLKCDASAILYLQGQILINIAFLFITNGAFLTCHHQHEHENEHKHLFPFTELSS